MVDVAGVLADAHVLVAVDVVPVGVGVDAAPGLAVVAVKGDAGVVQAAFVPKFNATCYNSYKRERLKFPGPLKTQNLRSPALVYLNGNAQASPLSVKQPVYWHNPWLVVPL